jgi:WD40 repeat protein
MTSTPYVGLVPYDEADAVFFFGRDEEKRIVTGNLRASRLTIVYGSSGVGKTSLLRAGVVNDLRAQMLGGPREERAPFAVCVFGAWRDDPVAGLMAAIHAAAAEALGGAELPAWQAGDPVVSTLRAWTERVRTLLVILDQFEDYFLYHDDDRFANALTDVVNEPNLHVNVMLAIRDDAWAKLDRFEGRIPRLFANYIRIEHLTRATAREAIELPVAEWNRRLPPGETPYRLEAALVEEVIDAAATGGLTPPVSHPFPESAPAQVEEIEAPFLQLVMQRLWRAAVAADSRTLTRATLADLGGAQQIVENHLLDALGELTPRERLIASALFRFLVTQSKTKISHSAMDLADWTRQPEPEVTAVLEKLCRRESGRILRRVPPADESGSMRYELFHDVLAEPITEWRRGFDEERARRAALRRLVRVGSVLLSLAAVFAALGIWALVQRSDAKRAARSAASLALASESRTELASHVDRSLLLALAAYTTSPTTQAAGAMVSALQSPRLTDTESILRGGDDGVRALAFSSDGDALASADFDGTLRLWDLVAHRPLGDPIRERTGEVWSVAFAPGTRLLAAAAADGSVRLWDTRTGTPLARTRPGAGAVRSVTFAPGGRLLASAGDDGIVWLRDPHTLAPVGRPLRDDAGRIISIAFTPDGRTLAAAGFDDVIRLWDVRSRVLLRRLRYDGRGPVLSLAFSGDGRLLAASCEDGTVRMVDLRTRRFAGAPLDAHAGAVWGLALSHDGTTLAASGFDGTVRLWDVASRTQREVLRGHTRALTALSFAPGGRLLASASYDGTVRLWSVPPRARLPRTLRPPARQASDVAFGADGRFLVSGGFGPALRVWDVAAGTVLREGDVGSIETVAFGPDGRTIATGGDDGTVRLFEAPSLRPIGGPLEAGDGAVQSVRFSADGKLLAAGGDFGVRAWRVPGREPAATRAGSGRVSSIAVGPGDTLAWASSDGTASFGNLRLPLGPDELPLSVAISPDGRTLAIGEVDGRIRLWDVRRRRWAGEPLRGPVARVESVAFTPNGRVLVSGGDDGTVRLWDVRGRAQLGRALDAGGGTVTGVAVSPDGRTIASTGKGGGVDLWLGLLWTDTRDLRALVCRRVAGDLTRSEWQEVVPGLAYRSSCGGPLSATSSP